MHPCRGGGKTVADTILQARGTPRQFYPPRGVQLGTSPQIPERSPNVLFSRLAPRTRIPPHNGFLNTRLVCHLPLIVPPSWVNLRCVSESGQ